MDLKGFGRKNKKMRISSSSEEDDNSRQKKIRPPSIPLGSGSGSEAERCFVELLSRMMPMLSHLVQQEVQNALQTHFHPILESLREKRKEMGEEVIIEPETEKFKIVFCNEINSIIFTNNEIRSENGEPLRIAICDATTNVIICTGLLSSALIEFFVLDGEYGSGQQEKETHRMLSDFNKSVLSPRDGKRPLMVGNDQKIYLENGVAFIKNLCITDNSSWMKSKKFRLGAMIRDEKTLAEFPSIRVAVSQPFRVMDHRGEVNKKHHPPSRDDDVWRLEGIGKEGAYHKNLALHGIRTVGDFLKAHREMGSTTLKKLLGIKVPKKTWMMMIDNAYECDNNVPTYSPQSSKAIMLGDEDFNEPFDVYAQKYLGYGLDEAFYQLNDEAMPSFFPGEASTSYEAVAQAVTPNLIKDLKSI